MINLTTFPAPKWRCANNFYVLIGSTICQHGKLSELLTGTVSQTIELGKLDRLAATVER